MDEEMQRYQLLTTLEKALKEMEMMKEAIMFESWIAVDQQWELYQEKMGDYLKRMEELKSVYEFVNAGGSGKKAYYHMHLEIFNKHESFFMDLFEGIDLSGKKTFPQLFELYEFVWR
jgi:hypothetical protein